MFKKKQPPADLPPRSEFEGRRSASLRTGPMARNNNRATSTLGGSSGDGPHGQGHAHDGHSSIYTGAISDGGMNMNRTSQRRPDKNVPLANLLAAYDDYPRVVSQLEETTQALHLADDSAQEAEDARGRAESALELEKRAREADGVAAEERRKGDVREKERAVRAELDPKIKDLTERLAAMTKDRDGLKGELKGVRDRVGRWADRVESLGKERRGVEEKERVAAEDRKRIAGKLEALDEEMIQGLKEEAGKPVKLASELKEEKEREKGKGKEKESAAGLYKEHIEGGGDDADAVPSSPKRTMRAKAPGGSEW